ncbi:MAG: lytic transglycosylase domain-containing protein, partial [Nanoarchaeota archaeon]|nr:lytic transglycosylase domain-containing protein [Nanoarchaeota archaeon]
VSYVYELEKSVPVEVEKVEDYKSPEEAITKESEIEELKSQPEIKDICSKDISKDISKRILKCEDYNLNYYDKLGFSDQVWCDADPCKLMCYSSFKEDEGGVYYDSCGKCPEPIPEELKEYAGLVKDCGIYLSEDYCKKDSCNFGYYDIQCKWENTLCVRRSISTEEDTEHGLIEQGCELTREERIQTVKDIVDETNTFVPREIVLGVAQQEYGFEHCSGGNNVVKGGDGEIGLMQILPSTAKEFCSGITENQLRDLDLNIRCGIKVLEGKYNRYVVPSGLYPEGIGLYEVAVNNYCKKSEHPDENALYLSYMDNGWDMTLRAYNGFSCVKGDLHYVEHVREKIEEFGFD